MAKVFITYPLPESGAEKLRAAGHEVTVRDSVDLISREDLVAALKEYDAVLPLLTDTLGAPELAEAGEQLKVIANYAVGYDNIDVSAAAARGITVTNTPGVLTDAVAEHTIALLIAIARRVVEADQFTRDGKYEGWRPQLLLGTSLTGKTLGIIGLGRIGTQVATRAKHGFGMDIAYNDLRPNADFEAEFQATYYTDLKDMLPLMDAITLHVPLLPATQHLINAERLATMKSSAVIVNTSRGPVIDEDALVMALQNKVIQGAALDVFEDEPKLKPGLAALSNVVLTPHIASGTLEARSAMADLAADNIIAVLAGQQPPTVINP